MMNSLFGGMFFPFMSAGMLIISIIGIIFFVFWIFMLVDCIKRKFRNKDEKIVWILVIVLTSWIGSLVYLFAIRLSNPIGLSKHKS